MNLKQDSQEIAIALTPLYTPANVGGGHDVSHVLRMIEIGKKIKLHLDFDWDEYVIVCWLHNIDRCHTYKKDIKKQGLANVISGLINDLTTSGFAKTQMLVAILQHNKKDDDLEFDSSLLTALRIADKLDRLGPLGIVACAAHRGGEKPAYHPTQPFGYDQTHEDGIKTIYTDYFRVLEWYGMLPYDWARDLVNKKLFTVYIDFLRALGEEIALVTQTENAIENDIQRALGQYYQEFSPKL